MSTEQKLPKRMGRPPKPGGPVSNKELQQLIDATDENDPMAIFDKFEIILKDKEEDA